MERQISESDRQRKELEKLEDELAQQRSEISQQLKQIVEKVKAIDELETHQAAIESQKQSIESIEQEIEKLKEVDFDSFAAQEKQVLQKLATEVKGLKGNLTTYDERIASIDNTVRSDKDEFQSLKEGSEKYEQDIASLKGVHRRELRRHHAIKGCAGGVGAGEELHQRHGQQDQLASRFA